MSGFNVIVHASWLVETKINLATCQCGWAKELSEHQDYFEKMLLRLFFFLAFAHYTDRVFSLPTPEQYQGEISSERGGWGSWQNVFKRILREIILLNISNHSFVLYAYAISLYAVSLASAKITAISWCTISHVTFHWKLITVFVFISKGKQQRLSELRFLTCEYTTK